MYNVTGISSNTTGLYTLFSGLNDGVMGGSLGLIMMLIVSAITLITFMRSFHSASRAFLASSFISFSLSLFLRAMSMIPDIALIGSITMLSVSLVIVYLEER